MLRLYFDPLTRVSYGLAMAGTFDQAVESPEDECTTGNHEPLGTVITNQTNPCQDVDKR